MSNLPLAGIRILDLSRLLPGPYATLMLSDMGAEVVKVEEPGQGDYARWMPPMVGESGAPFVALNRGKKSITLNLKSAEGAAVLKRLTPHFDIIVEGFRPGVLDRLGVGYEVLRGQHPRIIWCSISGFGQTGPYRHRAGHDIGYVALSGLLGIQGPVGGPPEIPGVQVADIAGGALQAVSAITAALFQRERTGEGAYLDISMCEGALALMMFHLAGPLQGVPSEPPGDRFLSGALINYGVYRTRDGRSVALGALEPRFWKGFCLAVGRPELSVLLDATGEERDAARWQVTALMMERTAAEWAEFAAAHDVCVEVVLTPEEVINFPLHRERGMFGHIYQPGVGEVPAMRTPQPFGRDLPFPSSGSPRLGEHTEEILRSRGFSEDEIAQLYSQEII